MNLEQLLDKTGAKLDQVIEQELDRNEDFLADHGATAAEFEAFMGRRRLELAEWRAAALVQVREWLTHDCQRVH